MSRSSCEKLLYYCVITMCIGMLPLNSQAQFGVGYHQSNLSFVAFNYEIKSRFKPEIRIATNVLDEDFSIEAVALYDILNKENYEFYVGAGVRTTIDEGVVLPVGLNIYPFPFKNFGFHLEVAPVLNDYAILRGSWGIRYRFLRSEK